MPEQRRSVQELESLGKRLGGIAVGEVLPGSAADLAGVELGDVVLRVNGIATPTFEEFLVVAEAHLAHLEFEVFRDGHLLRLSDDPPASS
ncbi:MAG TPA: PDZ domain-containing protein [Polyangiaceae bacterium]|nr:PDZ domain-containing protein [Polyangiaceae bacterium]